MSFQALVLALCFSMTVSTSGSPGTFSVPVKLKPSHDTVSSHVLPSGSPPHFNGTLLTGMLPNFRRKKSGSRRKQTWIENNKQKQSKTNHGEKNGRQPGKYDLVPINHYAVGTVVIGNQPFEVVFDSGSTALWAFGEGVNKDKFITNHKEGGKKFNFQHNFYDRKESTTLKELNTPDVVLSYVDGVVVSGDLGLETVRVGDIVVKGTPFVIVDSLDKPKYRYLDYDGIFGLSFLKLRRQFKKGTKRGSNPYRTSPFMQMTQMGVLKRNMYSVFMAEDGSTGEICFGGWNEKHFKGDINVVSVVLGEDKKEIYDNEWLVELNHVGFVGKDAPLPGSDLRALIDTGSSVIWMPKSLVVKMCTDDIIQRALLNPDNPGGLVPCGSRHTLPKLEFHIGDKKYSLSGTEYSTVVNYVDEEGGGVELCPLLIVVLDTVRGSTNEIIIGSPFLRKFYAMFDFGENPEELPKIHFAEAVHSRKG